MTIDVVTIFPRMIDALLAEGIVARAAVRGVVDVKAHDLRDFTDDAHRTVDDAPFGGGPGMVLKAEPFLRAVDHIARTRGPVDRVVLTSPQGGRFTHALAGELAALGHIVVLCGRYEGVDERVSEALSALEVSIGDVVLTGGELPALMIVDAVTRLVPGAVGDAASVQRDSFAAGVLDHPHYTRPAIVRGLEVPAVLLSGHHEAVERWRRREALRRTLARRPDLLEATPLDAEDRAILDALRTELKREQDDERD